MRERRTWVTSCSKGLSVRAQCRLLGLARSSLGYEPVEESALNLELMRKMDEIHLHEPTYGVVRMQVMLGREGYAVNEKRVRRLMRKMGFEAIYPKPKTSLKQDGHEIHPYLLRELTIERVNQVWSTDITYIPMAKGFMYLVAIMDWFSRYVLSWEISNTMDTAFCLDALAEALRRASEPAEIFNTDQGSQFTSTSFVEAVQLGGMLMSMDGKGQWVDNVFIERLWRSFKYEDVYLRDYADGRELEEGAEQWFEKYNQKRPHQSLGWRTPAEVYFAN